MFHPTFGKETGIFRVTGKFTFVQYEVLSAKNY